MGICRIRTRWASMMAAVVVAIVGPARAEATPATCDREATRCELVTGANCRQHIATARDPRLDPQPVAELEAAARTCDVAWKGPKGCYERRVREEIDGLRFSEALIEARSGALNLPDEAHEACQRLFPQRLHAAIDEVPAWCATGRAECVAALQEAHAGLKELPRWLRCVDEMKARAQEIEQRDAELALCALERTSAPAQVSAPTPTQAPAPAPTQAPAPAPAQAPAPSQAPAPTRAPTPAPTPTPPLDVVEITRGRVLDPPQPLASVAGPHPTADPTDAEVSRSRDPRPLVESPHRKGQLEIGVTPFSGVVTVRDPVTGVDHSPNLASLLVGVDVATPLGSDLVIELGINARAAFGSTVVGKVSKLEDLETESGTIFYVDLEPSAALLWRYLGVGLVAGYRWDSISVTSESIGLASTEASGGGGGLRLVAGFGLLDRGLRVLGTVDWLFVGTESTAIRAAIQADIGPVMILGTYRQHFRLGRAAQAYLVDDLQLTLGYRGAF